ncbi:MAG: Response regulator with CheY-like receiver, AAA-type ATPase, and DNA-binding domain, partial [Verrucomicrobiaceae bacterium]|nr:Response regulator with CheY-like receiver, AAA-type ATPase, and DNA-binding domain [Verrucomicrobiaceae bacterium]
MTLGQFTLAFQRIDPDCLADEIVDAIWLAAQGLFPARVAQDPLPEAVTEPVKITANLAGLPSITEENPMDQSAVSPPLYPQKNLPRPPVVPVYTAEPGEKGGLALRVPGGRALPGALALARALRPLMRHVPSRIHMQFNEEATVRRICDEKIWMPVLTPARARWLEVALIMDDNSSMLVWQQTLREMRHLLEHQGAFRDVRSWSLDTSAKEIIVLRAAPREAGRSHRELINPTGRRLIIIATDCLGEAWKGKAMANFLAMLGASHPVMIWQMLPQTLWRQTALQSAQIVYASATEAASPNFRLSKEVWRPMPGEVAEKGQPIPVVTGEPARVQAWARLVAGVPRLRLPAVILRPTILSKELPRTAENKSPASDPALKALAEQLILNFRNTATPPAFKLACLMASAPLRLPVMRLVQQAMLPGSGQIHLAEFFLSGLIERITPPDQVVEPDEIDFNFCAGVRDLLLNGNFFPEVMQVQTLVSEYVSSHFGQPLDFQAIVADPGSARPFEDPSIGRQFATVTAENLRRLGRKYAAAADQLEGKNVDFLVPVHPKPVSDFPVGLGTYYLNVVQYSRLIKVLSEMGLPEVVANILLPDPEGALWEKVWSLAKNARELAQISVRLIAAVAATGYHQIWYLRNDKLEIATSLTRPESVTYETSALTGIIGRATRENYTNYLPDVKKDRGYFRAEPSTCSELAVPISINERNRAIGVINIESQTIDAFSPREIFWFEELARSLATAILRFQPFAGIRILWVDDHPENNISESSTLESKGATLIRTLSTDEALRVLTQQKFHAIISDIHRRESKFAGLNLLRNLQKRGNQLPVVIYAGENAIQHAEVALGLGAQFCTNDFSKICTALASTFNVPTFTKVEAKGVTLKSKDDFHSIEQPLAEAPSTSARSIFLSYAQESPKRKDEVKALADTLQEKGFNVILDQDLGSRGPKEGWVTWSAKQSGSAWRVLLVASQGYLKSWLGENSPSARHGATYEAMTLCSRVYEAGGKVDFLRVVYFADEDKKYIPECLRSLSHYHGTKGVEEIAQWLSGGGDDPSAEVVLAPVVSPTGDGLEFIYNQPVTMPHFVGRMTERRELENILEKKASCSLLGETGIGKSSLLLTWFSSARFTHGREAHFVDAQDLPHTLSGVLAAFSGGTLQVGSENSMTADGAADLLSQWAGSRPAPPLILVDEAEALIRALDYRFFERLRGMLGRIILVFATCTSLSRVFQTEKGRGSPFANKMTNLRLRLLDEDAATVLAQRSGEHAGLLRYWAGNHPYFLQLFGDCLHRELNVANALNQFRYTAYSRSEE